MKIIKLKNPIISRFSLSVGTTLLTMLILVSAKSAVATRPWSGPNSSEVAASVAFCPFCAAINATFGEQIAKHEISVIAKMVEAPPETDESSEEFPKAKFEILQVLKGEQFVAKGMTFQTMLVGKYPVGEKFLVMGVEPPSVFWSMPMVASERVIKYLSDSLKLPPKGPDRLVFFQDYFEDQDTVVAYDAYDEFAIADYDDMVAMKNRIKRESLIKWINDPEIRIERRRLYLTMLALCGNPDDIPLLEGFLVSDDPAKREGLDALAAAYLTLKGEAGIALLEERFLTDFDDVEKTAEINAVLSALRFHGTEVSLLPRGRIAQAVRRALKHPQLADTVIPDLARWEDWSAIEELVELFKNCKDEYKYVRVPVVAYLHSCPKPEAKKYLKELEAIDPDSIRRAKFFMGEPMDDELDDGDGDDQETEDQNSSGKTDTETSDDADGDKSNDGDGEGDKGEPVSLLTVPVVLTEDAHDDQDLAAKKENSADSPIEDPRKTEAMGPELAESKPKNDLPMPLSALKTTTSNPVSNLGGSSVVTKAPPVATPVEDVPVAVVSTGNIVWLIVFLPIGFSLVFFVLIWSVVNGWFERLIV